MENEKSSIRSEEVQEVMGAIPPWILRWGITLFFIVVADLVTGSYFFKYPDVIVADMTLTGRYPVASIVSRASGKLGKLYVADEQEVKEGELLAVIENPANTENVFRLKAGLLNKMDTLFSVSGTLELGDIQSWYATYLQNRQEYENYHTLDYYGKKIAALKIQIEKYRSYYRSMKRQQQVVVQQHSLATAQYRRDSSLFVRQVLSPSEHETARNTWLQSLYALESGKTSLEHLRIQTSELEINLLDIELQKAEKERMIEQGLRTVTEQLLNAISGWELTYCIVSPIRGKVTFTTYWNENQYVPQGENVFTVVPGNNTALIGKAILPIERSGKVKIGQRVIVRFANFPDQEFGMVNGVVHTISLVPSDSYYLVEIAFPNGLTTNYGNTLPVIHEMKASAEIITEDLRLIERFFMPVKRVLKESLAE
jgi:HlyD family secretion protein